MLGGAMEFRIPNSEFLIHVLSYTNSLPEEG